MKTRRTENQLREMKKDMHKLIEICFECDHETFFSTKATLLWDEEDDMACIDLEGYRYSIDSTGNQFRVNDTVIWQCQLDEATRWLSENVVRTLECASRGGKVLTVEKRNNQ